MNKFLLKYVQSLFYFDWHNIGKRQFVQTQELYENNKNRCHAAVAPMVRGLFYCFQHFGRAQRFARQAGGCRPRRRGLHNVPFQKFKTPFYAHIPVAGELIKNDVAEGLKYFDIAPTIEAVKGNKNANETALAKIEYVVNKGTMPPFRFTFVHWTSKLTADEKKFCSHGLPKKEKSLTPTRG